MHAGAAPGSPQIDQHRFMILQCFGKGKRILLRIHGLEIRERLPYDRLLFLSRGSAEDT